MALYLCSRCLATSTLLMAGAGLFANELVIRDLTIGLRSDPTDFDYTISGGGDELSGSDSFDSAYGLVIRGMYSFTGAGDRHGFLVGTGLTYGTADYGGAGGMTTFGSEGYGGYGFAITDRWHVAGWAVAGFQISNFELSSSSTHPSFSATGGGVLYGLEIETGFLVSDSILVGLDVGWRMNNQALTGDDLDVVLNLAGPTITLTFLWRLAPTPWRLE